MIGKFQTEVARPKDFGFMISEVSYGITGFFRKDVLPPSRERFIKKRKKNQIAVRKCPSKVFDKWFLVEEMTELVTHFQFRMV